LNFDNDMSVFFDTNSELRTLEWERGRSRFGISPLKFNAGAL
jgi:hypothetical protein